MKERKENIEIIFTAAHQNMDLNRLLQTLEFVQKKVVAGAKERSNQECFKAILTILNVGKFFA